MSSHLTARDQVDVIVHLIANRDPARTSMMRSWLDVVTFLTAQGLLAPCQCGSPRATGDTVCPTCAQRDSLRTMPTVERIES
jgi:hypothetical protein